MSSFSFSIRIFLYAVIVIGFSTVLVNCQRPHVVFIIADDLGWNDVSFHGSDQIQTPNIDALAYNGIILNSHYAQQTCTPSRTALLTGKYPMRLGMQGRPLNPGEGVSLPAAKLLPEYMKDLGYTTHLLGKWHLGYERWNNTPTYRGFDTFLGSYSGFNSYYDYVPQLKFNGKVYNGFDLRRGTEPAWDLVGQYATDVYTEAAEDIIKNHDKTKSLFLLVNHVAPHTGNEGKWLEAPQEAINKFKHIIDVSRRSYAGMVSKLDDSVGAIVHSLQENNMLDNSIVIFMSDNGAPSVGLYQNWGSNYPLRGIKGTLFEGGVRVPALIYSPLLPQARRVAKDLMHITDWLPTLMTAAGGDVNLEDIDGVDQWSSLQYDFSSPRTDALLNINEITRNAAIRYNNWKLIVGSSNNGTFDDYFGEVGTENLNTVEYNTSAVYNSLAGLAISKTQFPPTSEIEYTYLRRQATIKCPTNTKQKKNPCTPSNGEVCLYDIPSDPCEENNLVPLFPSVVRRLKRELVDFRAGLKPQLSQDPDVVNADPKLFDYTWNPWLDCADITCKAS